MLKMHRVSFFVWAVLLSVGAQDLGDNVAANNLFPASQIAPGRPLIIKNYPAVENYQSELYEVYAEPYQYAQRHLSAIALISSEGDSSVTGEVFFTQKHPPAGPVYVRGNITGLSEGKHGFHIHQAGDLREGCSKLGPHFNPFLLQHGDRLDFVRHVGDMGNLEANGEGRAEFEFVDRLMSLIGGSRSIIGRAVVITENPDDLGRSGTAVSLSTGDSGNPIACGVIAYLN
ncbi:superoxide dismutase [Cu-Zn]-like [Aethina tumida]|uniref:superoxide dismutase [Cu-Zn]-like n=1 Tax=Aethina tumida TaxID=116153 RepID=UPI002147921B|nr:superoxide dismutase [Cu-Zn]-like [Aethina tumida]